MYNPRLATNMTNLEKIILKTVVPPTLVPTKDYNTFTSLANTPKMQGLYVPAEALNAYRTADGWSAFADLIFPIE